ESTRMVFQMPWAFEDGMTWYQNWTDTYEDMQIHIYDNTLLYSEEIGFEIAPVGWAWYAVLEEYNYPLHYLHMSDWNHPSLRGSYLMACVIYSTVFQESTVNIPYHASIPEEEAVYFQTVASDTVLSNLELWNITPLVYVSKKLPKQNEFHLYQNYPNPVNHTTIISYSIQKEFQVRIIIFDALGTKVITLVDEIKRPGNYEIELNTSEFSRGIYFYQITAGNFSETKTMIKIEK
ncbi:MAG: T9SS type A sorting domain-containing protein, partial [Bacteroidales bacterium]|nr:T9SS type A sorting domain-containing protein [Bacteroidales bacterium]